MHGESANLASVRHLVMMILFVSCPWCGNTLAAGHSLVSQVIETMWREEPKNYQSVTT